MAGGAAFFEYLFYLQDSPYRYYPSVVGLGGLLAFALTLAVIKHRRLPRPPEGSWRGVGLGLDFGGAALKAVLLGAQKGGVVVLAAGQEPLPPGTVDADGLVTRPKEAGEAARRLLRRIGLKKAHRVVTTVGNGSAVIRLAQFPRMSREELGEALRWEGGQHIPIPLEQAVLDFSILESPRDASQMTVFLAAAPRRVAEALVSSLRLCHLRPYALDLEPNCALRALTYASLAEEGSAAAWAVLDLGASSTKLTLFDGAVPQITRTLNLGGQALTELLGRELGLDLSQAEDKKRQEGLLEGTSARAVLWPQLEELFMEVRRSLEYFLIQRRGVRLRRVFLLGGGASLPGLAPNLQKYLETGLATRVETENGLEVIVASLDSSGNWNERTPRSKRNRVASLGPEYFIALGSALRGD